MNNNSIWLLLFCYAEETKQVLRLSLTEFSLPKFYLLFGISKVKSAAVIAFRSSYRDRSFSPGSYERETFALSSLETVTEALLEIMEVLLIINNRGIVFCLRTSLIRVSANLYVLEYFSRNTITMYFHVYFGLRFKCPV